MIVVSATAGYGKTTAVREYMLRAKHRCAWISLSSSDELVFWDKLCREISHFSPEAAAELTEVSLPSSDMQAARVVDMTCRLPQKDFYLVIDDYHLLPDDGRVNELIRTIVTEEPKHFHVVLISRSMPNIGVMTFVSKQLCLLIRTQDLAFTNEETDGYLSLRGLRLTQSAVARICSAASGWISAIFLISEGVRNGLAAEECMDIEKLIEENFLDSLCNNSRSMLVKLSSLESFTAQQASFVLEDDRIIEVLDEMTRLNALIRRDADGTYHFHNLLCSSLRKRVSDKEFVQTCRRSAVWLEENGFEVAALCELMCSGAVEEVLAKLNRPQHPNRRFISGDRVGIVYSAMENEEACVKYPFPYLHIIFFSFISGIREYIVLAQKLLSIMESTFAASSCENRDRILGECCVIRCFSDASIADRHCSLMRAADFLRENKTELLFRDDAFTFGIPMHLYVIHKAAGQLDQSIENDAYTSVELLTEGLGHGKEKLLAAEAATERCDFPEARLRAEQALITAAEAGQSYVAAAALFALMRADLFEGNFLSAAERVEKIKKLPAEFNCLFDSFDCAAYASLAESVGGYMYACMGVPEKIALPLKRARANGGLMHNSFGFFTLIMAKEALLCGRFGEAETRAEECERYLLSSGSQLGRINAKIILAAAKSGLGETGPGIEILISILKEAEADGIILPFAENAKHILPLLEKIVEAYNAKSAFLFSVIKACRSYNANISKITQLSGVALTKRERDALRLASAGLSYSEIAKSLGVELVTAKKHLISSYKKLGVDNRILAVKAAESLGLFEEPYLPGSGGPNLN